MEYDVERIERLRNELEALRARVRNLSLQEAATNTDLEIRYEFGGFQNQVRNEMQYQHVPVRGPLREVIREVGQWLQPEDPKVAPMDLQQMDATVDRVSLSLEKAGRMARVAGTLESASAANEKVFEYLTAGDTAKAHSLIRQMIDVLQGVSREVRGMERGGLER